MKFNNALIKVQLSNISIKILVKLIIKRQFISLVKKKELQGCLDMAKKGIRELLSEIICQN